MAARVEEAVAEAGKKQNIKLPLPVKRSVLSMVLQVQPALPYAMTAAKLQHSFRAAGDEDIVNMLSQCTSWQHLTNEEKAKVEEAVPKCVQYIRYAFSLLQLSGDGRRDSSVRAFPRTNRC